MLKKKAKRWLLLKKKKTKKIANVTKRKIRWQMLKNEGQKDDRY